MFLRMPVRGCLCPLYVNEAQVSARNLSVRFSD